MESQKAILRDYCADDFEQVKAIHEQSGLDYQFPNLSSPLFLVTKVKVVGGVVRACGGLYLQVEAYLFMDRSDWASPEEKLEAIKELDRACIHEAYLRGIDCACIWLPPGMDRFGERLVEDLGFTKDREGWMSFSKRTS